MDEMQEQAARARALGDRPPSAEAWAELRAALAGKFEGTQAVALQVLGRWGGPDAVDELRHFLVAAYDRPYGWTVRGVAARALVRLVGAEDVDWVLDLYFGGQDALEKHELVPIVLAFPAEAARARLVAELASPDPLNRQAAVKAIGNMAFPDRRELLVALRDDRDSFVSRSATLLTRET